MKGKWTLKLCLLAMPETITKFEQLNDAQISTRFRPSLRKI